MVLIYGYCQYLHASVGRHQIVDGIESCESLIDKHFLAIGSVHGLVQLLLVLLEEVKSSK